MICNFFENLFYFYLEVPVVLGFVSSFLFFFLIPVHISTIVSSKIVDEFYMQLVSFSQLKGFLDVGRPLFFKFHEKMNIFLFSPSIVFEYIHFQIYV